MAVIAVRRPDIGKWTAYWLSLCLPGMGQLMAGSQWCLPWFAGIVFFVSAGNGRRLGRRGAWGCGGCDTCAPNMHGCCAKCYEWLKRRHRS